MKIADVKTFVVGNPPPGMGGKYFIFVRLTTDSGVVGYGEAYNATFGPHVTAAQGLVAHDVGHGRHARHHVESAHRAAVHPVAAAAATIAVRMSPRITPSV